MQSVVLGPGARRGSTNCHRFVGLSADFSGRDEFWETNFGETKKENRMVDLERMGDSFIMNRQFNKLMKDGDS